MTAPRFTVCGFDGAEVSLCANYCKHKYLYLHRILRQACSLEDLSQNANKLNIFWVGFSIVCLVGKVGQSSLTACCGDLLKAKDIFKKKWDCAIKENTSWFSRWSELVKVVCFATGSLTRLKMSGNTERVLRKKLENMTWCSGTTARIKRQGTRQWINNLYTSSITLDVTTWKYKLPLNSRWGLSSWTWIYLTILGGKPDHSGCCIQKEGLHTGCEDPVTPGTNLWP